MPKDGEDLLVVRDTWRRQKRQQPFWPTQWEANPLSKAVPPGTIAPNYLRAARVQTKAQLVHELGSLLAVQSQYESPPRCHRFGMVDDNLKIKQHNCLLFKHLETQTMTKDHSTEMVS